MDGPLTFLIKPAVTWPIVPLAISRRCTTAPGLALGDNLAGLKAARFVRDRVAPEKIVYKVNTVLGLAEAVEAGAGIGPLPCFIADRKPDLVRLSDLNPDFSAGLWLLTHPDLANPRGSGPSWISSAPKSAGRSAASKAGDGRTRPFASRFPEALRYSAG